MIIAKSIYKILMTQLMILMIQIVKINSQDLPIDLLRAKEF
jgi:hypothetical protein